ncbi:MAG: hypothetical protein ACOZNI_04735 [Myxococcota bacterium]
MPGRQSLPIFVLLDDPKARERALEAGADDAQASWSPAELALRVRARTRYARSLREHASYDGLTELLARGTFLDAAGAHFAEAPRAWQRLAVGMVRVDGDARTALTRTAALLYARFRPPHLLARWGERDVAVLASGPIASNLAAELDDVRVRLREDFLWTRAPVVAFATVGMPADGITLSALLRAATARLPG